MSSDKDSPYRSEMLSKASSPLSPSLTPKCAPEHSLSFRSPWSPKKSSTSSTSSSIPSSQLPSPRSPPPRPPRPKTSLPNLRPTIILSPLDIPPPCAYRLPSPNQSIQSHGFSDEVFASLPRHLGRPHITLDGRTSKRGHPDHATRPRPPHFASPRRRSKECFDSSPDVHIQPKYTETTSRTCHISDCLNAIPEEAKALRPMDSFERAIYRSRPKSGPTRCHLTALQSPECSAIGASPTKTISQHGRLLHSPTKPESSTMDVEHNRDETVAAVAVDNRLIKRWDFFLNRHRRVLYILATLFFVIVATAAIAGGVIWKLSTLGRVDLSRRQQ